MNEIRQFPRVMVTGHRSFSETELQWLTPMVMKTARSLKNLHGMEEAISGMAIGADTLWARVALKLSVPLAAYIPFEEQPNRWPGHAQELWRSLREAAHREVVVGPKFSVGYLHARNDAMLRDSELCLALYRKSETRGGTASAVVKARKLGKPLLIIDPELREITREN